MPTFTDSELEALVGDVRTIEVLSVFQAATAARRPDGWDGEIGSRLSARYVAVDVAGNVFLKETESDGVRLGYVPRDLIDHVADGGRLADYEGPVHVPPMSPPPVPRPQPRQVRIRVDQVVEGEPRTPYAWAFVPSRRAWVEEKGRRVASYTQPRIEASAAPGVHIDPGEGEIGIIGHLVRSVHARSEADAIRGVERRTVAVVTRRVQAAALLPGPDGPETRAAEAYSDAEAEARLAAAVVGQQPYHHIVWRGDGLDLTLFPQAPRELLPSPYEPVETEEERWSEWAQRQGRWLLGSTLGLQSDDAPLTLQVRVPVESAEARFAWSIEEDGGLWRVRIHRTADVRVDLADGAGALQRFERWVDYEEHEVAFENAGALDWGVSRPATRPAAAPPMAWVLALELGLGALPIVGELSDLADLAAYTAFGTDKWGIEMTRTDVALTLLGLGMVGATGATARAAYRYGRRLPTEIAEATGALTTAEKRALRVLQRDIEAVRAGQRTDAPPVETFGSGWKALLASVTLGRLSRALGAQTTVGARRYAFKDFVNHTDDGFFVPELNEAYAAYRRATPDGALGPRAWLRRGAPDELRQVVETLMGPRAFDIETATTADAYARAVRREAAQPGGPPRGEVGRGWPWDRLGRPEDYEGYVWRRGDPIDAPRTRGRDYPSYDVARGRAWKNVAYFELQTRLGTALDPPPTPSQLWIRCRDAGLLDAPRRPTYISDTHNSVSTIELLYMYEKGQSQTDVQRWVGMAAATVDPKDASRSAALARLELRRRFGDSVKGNKTPAQIRSLLGEGISTRRPTASPHTNPTPRGFEDLSDDELLQTLEKNTSPFKYERVEFEHDVPQRSWRRLRDAIVIEPDEAQRLTAQASPGNLFAVSRTEHGFFDAEVSGHVFDDRLGNPFARLSSAEVQELLATVHAPGVRVRDRAMYSQVVGWLDEVAAARWSGLD